MSIEITAETKRWTAKRKPALTLEIIQGKTTASEAIRQCDLARSEIEDWLDNAKAGPFERTLQYRALLQIRPRTRLRHGLGVFFG